MVNIDMWHHPKYYKELRKRNKLTESRQPVVGGQQQSDQVISLCTATAASGRAPGPGLKPQASSAKLRYTPTGILLGVDLGDKPQAPSKPEPSSGSQASSAKRQASQPE
jgi:hypothetical protein